jgi:hypothetical protein
MAQIYRLLVVNTTAFIHQLTNAIKSLWSNRHKTFQVGLALFWSRSYWLHYWFAIFNARYRSVALRAAVLLLAVASFYYSPVLQEIFWPYLAGSNAGLPAVQSLLLNVGSALIGAAAIAFSLVMFAMQVNVERMPHGLFRKFTDDKRIMGAFIATFLLAIFIACTSLVANPRWIAVTVILAAWAVVGVIGLFLFAYRRALWLINPVNQLGLVVQDAHVGLRRWVRWATRAAPLAEAKLADDESARSFRSNHDIPRLVYFENNPHWTTEARRAVRHANSFARRYAEQGDYEVAGAALNSIVKINGHYIEAKGKTFFAAIPFVDTPSSDAFINASLEDLRQNVRIAVARGDEQQAEQTLRAVAALSVLYLNIDYSSPLVSSKTHAHLAATYLSNAVKSIASHNMPDVVMEGARLIGQSASAILRQGSPSDVATLTDDLRDIAGFGIVNEKYRPASLTVVEQFRNVTFALIQSEVHDISFLAERLRTNVAVLAKLFLQVPDPPLGSHCSTALGPYYSGTSTQTLLGGFTELCNSLGQAKPDNARAKRIVQNFERWADGVYQPQKDLFLAAIEKRSLFAFDMAHWITQTSKLLLVISMGPACPEHTAESLRKHAGWLIYTFSWIPDNEDVIAFLEGFQITEMLFEVAFDAQRRGCREFSDDVGDLLLSWGFKAEKYQTGWRILEKSLYGLATLAILSADPKAPADLKRKVAEQTNAIAVPDYDEIRRRTTDEIRDRVANFSTERYSHSLIEQAMRHVDRKTLSALLQDIADAVDPQKSSLRL